METANGMHKIGRLLVTMILIVTAPILSFAARDFGPHVGYIEDPENERDERYEDMVVIQPPPPLGPSLRERIFNQKLVKEFSDKYDETFGRTDVEREYHAPTNRFTYYDDLYGFRGTPQELMEERRRFGDFMIRRLTEFHVDNYAKSDPKVRPVWEAKERLSNIRVEVKRVRFDLNYSIAGNIFDLKVINPWLSLTRVRVQMDPTAFGPAQIQELIMSIGRPLTRTLAIESHVYTYDGIVSVIGRKSLAVSLSGSLTASTYFKPTGKSRRETLYLAGLSYSF